MADDARPPGDLCDLGAHFATFLEIILTEMCWILLGTPIPLFGRNDQNVKVFEHVGPVGKRLGLQATELRKKRPGTPLQACHV